MEKESVQNETQAAADDGTNATNPQQEPEEQQQPAGQQQGVEGESENSSTCAPPTGSDSPVAAIASLDEEQKVENEDDRNEANACATEEEAGDKVHSTPLRSVDSVAALPPPGSTMALNQKIGASRFNAGNSNNTESLHTVADGTDRGAAVAQSVPFATAARINSNTKSTADMLRALDHKVAQNFNVRTNHEPNSNMIRTRNSGASDRSSTTTQSLPGAFACVGEASERPPSRIPSRGSNSVAPPLPEEENTEVVPTVSELPIAAELAPDIEEMEAQIRKQLEQEIMSEMRASTETMARSSTSSVPARDSATTASTMVNLPNVNSAPSSQITTTAIMENLQIERVDFDRSRPFSADDMVEEDSNDSEGPISLIGSILDGSARSHRSKRSSDHRRKIPMKMVWLVGMAIAMVLVIVGTVVGVTTRKPEGNLENNGDNSVAPAASTASPTMPGTTKQPVLQAIRERGYLKCKPESFEAEMGKGFTIDLCRAIAAAVFGDADMVEFPYFGFREHFEAVHNGELDVSTSHVSLNMGRDVREQNSQTGYTYSTPYFYTGTALAGVPEFVECAEKAETFQSQCRHLQVCVMINTVTQDIVEAHLPGSATKLVPTHGELFHQFANGTCNVIAGDTVNIYEQRVREVGYEGEYTFANKLLSHEHLALLTREDDPQWADFCNWVLRALVTAEALNITQETAQTFSKTTIFGREYEDMFVNAIAAVGNYAEVYDRTYGGILPRSQYDMINTGESGLIVSDPLGTLLVDEETLSVELLPKPIPDGTMETVLQRGYLICGLAIDGNDKFGHQAGLAAYNRSSQEWEGLDVDYCTGLAASIFAGHAHTKFVDLSDRETRYRMLANGTVDVLAGDKVCLTTDIREPTTGHGFTFGTPYFYYGTTTKKSDGYARALVTRQDDAQWSDLTNWITHATFYAEEHNITRVRAVKMPVVELFGIEYKQMFRDAIHATGNYGEMYERNMQSILPRTGRNLLNVDDTPQFYPIPFE